MRACCGHTPRCIVPASCLHACIPLPAQIISLVARLQARADAPCPEPLPPSGAGARENEPRAGALADFGPSSAALALPGDRKGSTTLGGGAALLDRRRHLGVASAMTSKAAKQHASNGSRNAFGDDDGMLGGDRNGDSRRAGSQSPRGPQTPVEGAHALLAHPATRQLGGGCTAHLGRAGCLQA